MHSRDLNDWLFTLADEREAWAKGADDSSWRAVVVPHDWSVEQPFTRESSSGTGYLPGGIGWYRAHVPLSELGPLEGRHLRLVFHGVYKNARVWVNGYHLGQRPSGYARFVLDLTEIVSYAPDDDLVIAVRVEHVDSADSRWFNGAGITRRVELQVHDAVRLTEAGTAFTTVRSDRESARVHVQQQVVADHDGPARVRHELVSLTSGRTHVAESTIDVTAGRPTTVDATIDVPEPELWSPAAPHLYRLDTSIAWTGRGDGDSHVAAAGSDVVGIRMVVFDPDTGLWVNGERDVLKGVCLHEDAGCVGTAVPADVWLRRLLTLKEMGCNAVRMAHNPHAPELYALCDVVGLYVVDEAFDEWDNPKNKWWQGHNVYPPKHDGYAHDFPEWSERDLVAMIEAHRTHPSIIAWSIGNEIDYPNDPYASPLFAQYVGNNDANKPASERLYDPNRPDARRLTTIATRLAGIVRRTDPSRPVTVAAAFPELSSQTGLIETVDLVGYNYKEHLYDDDHRRFPHLPFVGSENGHEYAQWRSVVDREFISGQFLWTGIDYLGEARGWPVHGSGAGLMTLAGFPKPGWHLRRAWWSGDPVAHVATRPVRDDRRRGGVWDAGREWGGSDAVEVLCFVAGGDPVLRCGEQQVPLTRDERLGCWTATLVPRSEPLLLEVHGGDGVVARDELAPRGAAVGLVASRWVPPADVVERCAAAGLPLGEVAQVEVHAVDERGNPAVADVQVEVEVDDGDLLGVENGDLADTTPYSRSGRATHDGRLLVLARCTDRTRVVVSAEGLASVSIECGSRPLVRT